MDITNFANSLLIQPNSDGSAPTTGTLSSASDNVGIGRDTFKTLTSAAHNVCVGNYAGDALTSGGNNCVLGTHALSANQTGGGSIAIGYAALNATNVGYNIGIGYNAGNGITSGAPNICIGKEADTGAVDSANAICIGDTITAASNDFSFGKSSNVVTNDFDTDADWSRSSDERLKTNIQTINYNGLDFINELRPVTYNWKRSQDVPTDMVEYRADENLMTTDVDIDGMIAQEGKAAMDTHNITTSSFRGWKLQESGTQSLSKAAFVLPLIKAVQELSAKNAALEARIIILEG